MRMIMRIAITALLMSGGIGFNDKPSLYYRMLKAMVIKIDKGLPPMLPYTEKLTGKKFSY